MTQRPSEAILVNWIWVMQRLRNNAGGYYNHCLFWEVINPNDRGTLSGDLEGAIVASFGPLKHFKILFQQLRQVNLAQDGLGYVFIQVVL